MIDLRAWATPATVALGAMDDQEAYLRGQVKANGRKYSKPESGYVPVAPPPAAYRYECGACRFFVRQNRTCAIVGLRTDPGGERIDYSAYCVFSMPPAGETPGAWLLREVGASSK